MKQFALFISLLMSMTMCHPALAEKQLDRSHAVKLVEQMRGISMKMSPSGSSDAHPDPLANSEKKILAELAACGQNAIPPLVFALKDKDVQMRKNACLVLINLAGTWTSTPKVSTLAALPALIEATKDRDQEVRAWAAHAIAEIGPAAESAVPALTTLLKDRYEGARNDSAMALGAIGPKAQAAIPALKKALVDPKPDVRKFAQKALEQIGNIDAAPQSMRVNPSIKAAELSKIQEITTSSAWENPFITIENETVAVSWGHRLNKRFNSAEDAEKFLLGLPVSAWPYGRIVGLTKCGPSSGTMRSKLFRQENWDLIWSEMQRLNIKVNLWPSA